MSRKFGMIASSLWASRRFGLLGSSDTKLAYVYLHTNTHGNSIGAYRLPVAYLTADLGLDAKQARQAIAEICKADLAEYDADESVIRIQGWFNHNPITNRKHLQGAINAFHDVPSRSKVLPRVALEMSFSAVVRARNWSLEGKGYEARLEVMEMAADLCRKARMNAGEKHFHEVFDGLPEDLRIGLSEALPIGLPIQYRQRQIQETETETETETHTETETAKTRDLQDDIRELTEKAAKAGR